MPNAEMLALEAQARTLMSETESPVGVGFVEDPCKDFRELHGRAISQALNLASKVAVQIVEMDRRHTEHQEVLTTSLNEIKTSLQKAVDRLEVGKETMSDHGHKIANLEKDVTNLGTIIRGHIEEHTNCANMEVAAAAITKHMEWHQEEIEKKAQAKKKFLEDHVHGPLIKMILAAAAVIFVMGFQAWLQTKLQKDAAREAAIEATEEYKSVLAENAALKRALSSVSQAVKVPSGPIRDSDTASPPTE